MNTNFKLMNMTYRYFKLYQLDASTLFKSSIDFSWNYYLCDKAEYCVIVSINIIIDNEIYMPV